MRKTIGLYVPVRDGGVPFQHCLRAIAALDPQPDRLLIVDDGSVDDSGPHARARGWEVIRKPRNLGLGAARNTGWRHLETDWIAALDADCAPAPDWLGRLAHALASMNPQVAGVGGRLIETGRRPGDRWRRQWLPQDWGLERRTVPFLYGANGLLRRSALEAVGGYDERFTRNAEDWQLGQALRAAGFSLEHLPEAQVHHWRRDRAASALSNYWRHRFYGHRESLGWRACGRSAITALRSAASMFRQDLIAGRGDLLLMDLALAPLMIARDVSATWAR